MLKRLIQRVADLYLDMICRRELTSPEFPQLNERVCEFRFVFNHLASLLPRTILDVGTGRSALPHLFYNCGFITRAVDPGVDYWGVRVRNRHFYVEVDDIKKPALRGPFDLITCISALEHIVEYDAALESMAALLAPGGHLILTFPYSDGEYCPDVYKLPGSLAPKDMHFVTQAFSREQLLSWEKRVGLELVEQEYWRFFTGKHWSVGERLAKPLPATRDTLHQLTCVLFRKRVAP